MLILITFALQMQMDENKRVGPSAMRSRGTFFVSFQFLLFSFFVSSSVPFSFRFRSIFFRSPLIYSFLVPLRSDVSVRCFLCPNFASSMSNQPRS